MKRIENIRMMKAGQVLTYQGGGSRNTISGVATGVCPVYAQARDMEEPALIACVTPGEFRLEVGHVTEFAVWFEPADGASVAVYMPPGAHEVVHMPEDTWTTVNHRPAINPQLAAIQREMQSLRMHIVQSQSDLRAARAAARAAASQPRPADEPAAEPAAKPARKAKPAAVEPEPAADEGEGDADAN